MKELQNHVKTNTASYKYPRGGGIVDELPKTISGKIRRVKSVSGTNDGCGHLVSNEDGEIPMINHSCCGNNEHISGCMICGGALEEAEYLLIINTDKMEFEGLRTKGTLLGRNLRRSPLRLTVKRSSQGFDRRGIRYPGKCLRDQVLRL